MSNIICYTSIDFSQLVPFSLDHIPLRIKVHEESKPHIDHLSVRHAVDQIWTIDVRSECEPDQSLAYMTAIFLDYFQ